MFESGGSTLKLAPSKERATVKKYVVELTQDERDRLHELISAGSAPARMLNRARILLKADVSEHAEGEPLIDRQIAPMLETSTATVQRVRERFCRQGLDAALERSAPERVYERSFDGRAEARLIALACSQAPEGRERWSMRLLAEKAVQMGIVGSVSHETVRKTLKKTNCAPTW
jgi:transposase